MKTLTINQMEEINAGMSAASIGCNTAMAIAGGIWTTAIGVASLGVGFAFGVGWSLFQGWVCEKA